MTTTDPGNGLRVETLKYRNIHFTSWDMEDENRASWQGLVQQQDTKGLIYVVDSNDRESMSKAKDELQQMLKQVTGKAALLVIANKQDMPNSMNGAEVVEALGLNQVKNRPWHLQPTSGISGDGLYEAMDWLAS